MLYHRHNRFMVVVEMVVTEAAQVEMQVVGTATQRFLCSMTISLKALKARLGTVLSAARVELAA